MSTFQYTQGGFSVPSGGLLDIFMGFWDPVTNLPALADSDGYQDGMYWICSGEGDRDLGSGSIYWSRDDQVYRGEVTTGIYAKRELGPAVENTVITASGGIVQTAQGHPVWTY